MPKPRRHRLLVRLGKLNLVLGVLLLLLCAASFFWYVIYQQPPGVTIVTLPNGTRQVAAPPAGKVRIRIIGGSLIVSNGDLPWNGKVKVQLGYMINAGVSVSSVSSPSRVFTSPDNWKYHFYPEHVQVQLIPVGVLLIVASFLLSRRPPAWACQFCRYDLRGNTAEVCPECGEAKAA